jgi:hypothetical protein
VHGKQVQHENIVALIGGFHTPEKSDVYSYGVLLIEMGYGEASKIQEGMEYL